MTTRKPIPTEYCGIRFRTKSEALFAVAVNECTQAKWTYESVSILHEDREWSPDFLLVDYLDGMICIVIVEYKPGSITDTEKQRLADKFKHLHETLGCNMLLIEYVIFAGSPWNDHGWTMTVFNPSNQRYQSPDEALLQLFRTIRGGMENNRDRRFDLKQSIRKGDIPETPVNSIVPDFGPATW